MRGGHPSIHEGDISMIMMMMNGSGRLLLLAEIKYIHTYIHNGKKNHPHTNIQTYIHT